MSATNQPPAMVLQLGIEQLACARATGTEAIVKQIPSLFVGALTLSLSASPLAASDPVVTVVMD